MNGTGGSRAARGRAATRSGTKRRQKPAWSAAGIVRRSPGGSIINKSAATAAAAAAAAAKRRGGSRDKKVRFHGAPETPPPARSERVATHASHGGDQGTPGTESDKNVVINVHIENPAAATKRKARVPRAKRKKKASKAKPKPKHTPKHAQAGSTTPTPTPAGSHGTAGAGTGGGTSLTGEATPGRVPSPPEQSDATTPSRPSEFVSPSAMPPPPPPSTAATSVSGAGSVGRRTPAMKSPRRTPKRRARSRSSQSTSHMASRQVHRDARKAVDVRSVTSHYG